MYIQNIRGESAFQSGLILLLGALLIGIMIPITGKIFDKYGAKRLVFVGMFLLVSATVTFVFLTKMTLILYIIIFHAICTLVRTGSHDNIL